MKLCNFTEKNKVKGKNNIFPFPSYQTRCEDVVAGVKEAIPRIAATLPKELHLELLFDQSLFVKASIQGVLTEGFIAACLTGTMILLFLGS